MTVRDVERRANDIARLASVQNNAEDKMALCILIGMLLADKVADQGNSEAKLLEGVELAHVTVSIYALKGFAENYLAGGKPHA